MKLWENRALRELSLRLTAPPGESFFLGDEKVDVESAQLLYVFDRKRVALARFTAVLRARVDDPYVLLYCRKPAEKAELYSIEEIEGCELRPLSDTPPWLAGAEVVIENWPAGETRQIALAIDTSGTPSETARLAIHNAIMPLEIMLDFTPNHVPSKCEAVFQPLEGKNQIEASLLAMTDGPLTVTKDMTRPEGG